MDQQQSYEALVNRVAILEHELEATKEKLTAVQKAAQMYQQLVDKATDPIYVADVTTGAVVHTNPAAQKMVGRSIEKIEGHNLSGIVVPEDKPTSDARFKRLLNGETLEPQEYRIVSEGGKKVHVEAISFIIGTNDRKFVANIHRDTSHRKQVEVELRKTISHFNSLLENSDDYILLSDHEGKPIVWNRAYAEIIKEILGIDMEPGLQPHKLLPDKQAIAWWDSLHQRALSGEKFHVGYPTESPDGGLRHLDISYNPIVAGEQVNGFSEITRDVTELKEIVLRAEESEETARALLDAPKCYAALLDQNGIIVDANRAMAQRFGKNRDDFVGGYGWDLVPPDIAEERKAKFDFVVKSKKMARFEDERQGTWFDNIFYPILNAKQEVIKVGVFAFDITDQKEIEKQQREYIKEKEILVSA